MTNCVVTLGKRTWSVVHCAHAVQSVVLKGNGTTNVLYRHATFSPLPCFYSVLNSPSEKAQSSILFLYPSFALRRRSLSSSCLITSEARVACINLDWQDSEAWNALCRTSIKGRHSGDVALMECGSDSFNYLLTRCKPVALRDGLLGRMFSPSSRYDDASGIASRRAVAIFVSSRRVEVKVKSDTSLELRTHGAWKFPLLLAATWLPPQALQSMNIWDNLPVPFTFYIRQTLNPVWDAFTAIWSLLSHSPQHTHTHRDISLAMQYRTQLAWLPLYFIMRHVPVWDMDPDFIYVREWWLSYLRPSEIAVDQCR